MITECILACFFLALLLGIVGKVSLWKKESLEVDSSIYQEEKRKKDTIWIYPGKITETFSPLQYQTAGEENVISMCFSNLLTKNQEGKRINGSVNTSWEKQEEQLAHISYQSDANSNICHVIIEVNPYAKTTSGDSISADDILFNFYLRADLSSDIITPFGGVEIVGMKEYQYGTNHLDAREKEIKSALKKPSAALKKRLSEEIIQNELSNELLWVKSLYHDKAYASICSKYEQPKDLFAYYFAYETKYSSQGKNENQVFSEIVAQYNGDYNRLSKVTKKDYRARAKKIALSTILQKKGKDMVKTISGIRKTDKNTVEIDIIKSTDCVDKLCDFWLLPLSQYGDSKQFAEKESFGFIKGKAGEVVEKAEKQFAATGPYYLQKADAEKMIFVKNKYYFGQKAQIKEIDILRKDYVDYKEIVEDLLKQEIDIVFIKDSEELEELVSNRVTKAATRIRKENFKTSQEENCFLYRTSYINTPSIPKEISENLSLFQNIHKLKINK